jgi:hypothetical protein
MAGISELQQELADAERHLAEGHERIARQAEVVRQLDRHGHDTTDAENPLREMETALAAMGAHREQIVRELSRASDEQRIARH